MEMPPTEENFDVKAMLSEASMQSPEDAMPTSKVYNQSIQKNIESHLDSLDSKQQEFIAAHLTPEISQMFGLLLGQEAYDFFKNYENPEVILVPMPRKVLQQGKLDAMNNPNIPMAADAISAEEQPVSPEQPAQAGAQGLMSKL